MQKKNKNEDSDDETHRCIRPLKCMRIEKPERREFGGEKKKREGKPEGGVGGNLKPDVRT